MTTFQKLNLKDHNPVVVLNAPAGRPERRRVLPRYPKQSSKKYKSSIHRDNGWQSMGDAGFEPVRMVAIDEDWSAIPFRRVEFIKNMTRAKEHRLTKK